MSPWPAPHPESKAELVPEPLSEALAEVAALLVDPDQLVRAVASGRRRGDAPRWQRAELRPVTLKAGDRLQVSTQARDADSQRPAVRNVDWGEPAATVAAEMVAEPFGNWHVQTTTQTLQLRVTKRGEAQVHRAASEAPQQLAHDRRKPHLLDPGDPLFTVLGAGAAKRRQVDAFLRALDTTLPADLPDPLRIVDLGCGNAYLTFAAHRYLSGRGVEVVTHGVDVRADSAARNTELARRLDYPVRFSASSIADAADGTDVPHVVLALHACDTATDEALARAVRWEAPYVLAAPCCHHDVARQLRGRPAPTPYAPLTGHGILRERFADILTDALRAALLRRCGYRVDVTEFVASQHTPRNILLRAVRTGATATTPAETDHYDELVTAWGVRPRLAELLALPGVSPVIGTSETLRGVVGGGTLEGHGRDHDHGTFGGSTAVGA